MKTEITKIELKVNNKTIKLTAEEARLVHRELSRLFTEVEIQKEYVPVFPTPIIIDRTQPYYPPWDIITCEQEPNIGTLCMSIS